MTDWREELIKAMAKAAWPSDAAVKWEACLISLKQKHIDNARAALDVAEPVIREQEDNALREENARLREALKVASDFLDDAYTDIGRDEYKVAGFVARAAIREGGKDE